MLYLFYNRVTLWLLFTTLTSSFVSASSISGFIVDDQGDNLSGIVVTLEDAEGREHVTVTEEGYYAFTNLVEGKYLIYPETADDLQMDSPPCGFYSGFLLNGQDTNHDFSFKRGSGIMIDFGTSHGGGGKKASSASAPLSFDMSIFNLETMASPPNRIVVTGYFSVPGYGALSPVGVNGMPAGAYIGSPLVVNSTILAGPLVQFTLSYAHEPHIDLNGLLAQFNLQLNALDQQMLTQAKGVMSFCVTSIDIYHDQSGLIDSFPNAYIMHHDVTK